MGNMANGNSTFQNSIFWAPKCYIYTHTHTYNFVFLQTSKEGMKERRKKARKSMNHFSRARQKTTVMILSCPVGLSEFCWTNSVVMYGCKS